MEDKGFIGDKSWRSRATFAADGASAAGYSPTNLKDNDLSRVWRSADLTPVNTKFYATLDAQRPISVVGLANANFSKPNARVKINIYRDSARTDLGHTTGWLAWWDAVYDLNNPSASWDSGNAWDRIATELDTENRHIEKGFYLDNDPVGIAIEVEIDDEFNPDGYVQCGICEIAQGVYLPLNFQYGAQYGTASRTKVVQAGGGTEYAQANVPDDRFVGNSGPISREDALGIFYEFTRRTDKHTPFWWSPDPTDKLNALRHSFLAKNADISLNTYAHWRRDTVPFNFKRLL